MSKDSKTGPVAAFARPNVASTPQGAAAGLTRTSAAGSGADVATKAAALDAAFKRFNDRLCLFLKDMSTCYGKKYPAITDAHKQLVLFLRANPARRVLADTAWPQFDQFRACVNNRDVAVFIKEDLTGMERKCGVKMSEFWGQISANSKEAIFNGSEDLLDYLDDIATMRPFESYERAVPASGTVAIPTSGAPAANSAQKKSDGVSAAWWAEVDAEVPVASLPAGGDDCVDDEEDGKEAAGDATREWTRGLMGSLKGLMTGSEADADFDELMSKLDGPDDGKGTSAADQESMSRILTKFIDRIAPGAGGGDDDEEDEAMSKMSENEKTSERSRRQMEGIQRQVTLKRAVGKLMQIDALSQTNDPAILEQERVEAAAEKERAAHPEKSREYQISAHGNHKILLVLSKVARVRGHLLRKSKSDSKDSKDANAAKQLRFPVLTSSLKTLLRKFKENPGTEEIIRPLGAWVVAHRQQLLARDDDLFLKPDHDFLKELDSAALWNTFRPHERVNVWRLVSHPLQLATIFHHLDCPELRGIGSIVTDLLAGGGIAYDRDPASLDGKSVISKAIERGCTPGKIESIRTLFTKMQSEPDQRTLKSLARLMSDVIPSAAGFRDGGKAHNEDDADADAAEGPRGANSEEAKAVENRSKKMKDTFAQLLATMPALGPLAVMPNSKAASKTKPPANPAASAAAPRERPDQP